MAGTIGFRDYRPGDFARCVHLFDSNVPDFFLPTERPAFLDFLAGEERRPPRLREDPRADARFYLLKDGGTVVGCGGWYLEGEIAGLSWGIVDRARHRQGLGRLLVEERLRKIRKDGRSRWVRVRTIAAVQGFFQHLGFRLVRDGLRGVVEAVPLVELLLALE